MPTEPVSTDYGGMELSPFDWESFRIVVFGLGAALCSLVVGVLCEVVFLGRKRR